MKKIYYSILTLAFIAFIVMPIAIKAQTDERSIPARARQELRSDLEARQTNAKTNQNTRNNLLEAKASTTKLLKQNNDRALISSSTQKLIANKLIHIEIFKEQQRNIVHELQNASNNLSNIKDRIQARIDKASANGKDMTQAKNLLSIATTKIGIAQTAIDTIRNLSATSSTSILVSSSTIDLNKPRQIASAAQKALKDAQKALNDVIVSIAHEMGINLVQQKNDTHSTTTQ
ncbi:MAG: hypothetical protein WCK03_01755 [Candidatus Taylorbacteria bacterium]